MRPLLAIFLAVVAAGQQPSGFQIAGHVVRPSHNAVHGAHVSIFLPQKPDNKLSVVTGENGEFSFRDLAPGKYSLQVNDHGYAQLYKQDQEFSTAIAVGPGLDTEHIVFELQPSAQIAGSVVDEGGDPVRNANVYLFARWIHNGMPSEGLRQTKTTASDGTFHFTHLEPGTYFVAIAGRPWYSTMQPANGIDDPLDMTYPLTYYADSTSPDSATPIQLNAGDRSELHFVMQPVHSLHITLDGFDTARQHRVVATLRAIGPGGTLVDLPIGSSDSALIGVSPGVYRVSDSLFANNEQSPMGSQIVDFTSDATLRSSDAVKTTVKGSVTFAAGVPESVSVVVVGIGNSNQSAGIVKPDGSFDLGDVAPGRYNLSLANTPALYMQSVTVKGGAYARGVLQVEQGSQIEIAIKAAEGLGEIEGVAVRDGHPVAGAMVLAIPQDWSHGNFIPRDQSDSDGTFTLPFAPPGRYRVVAIDDGRGLAYANPDVIQPYLEKATVVTVPSTDKPNVTVQSREQRDVSLH